MIVTRSMIGAWVDIQPYWLAKMWSRLTNLKSCWYFFYNNNNNNKHRLLSEVQGFCLHAEIMKDTPFKPKKHVGMAKMEGESSICWIYEFMSYGEKSGDPVNLWKIEFPDASKCVGTWEKWLWRLKIQVVRLLFSLASKCTNVPKYNPKKVKCFNRCQFCKISGAELCFLWIG